MNTRIFVFVEVSFALFHVEMKPLKLPVTQQGSSQSKGGLRRHIIYSKVSEMSLHLVVVISSVSQLF